MQPELRVRVDVHELGVLTADAHGGDLAFADEPRVAAEPLLAKHTVSRLSFAAHLEDDRREVHRSIAVLRAAFVLGLQVVAIQHRGLGGLTALQHAPFRSPASMRLHEHHGQGHGRDAQPEDHGQELEDDLERHQTPPSSARTNSKRA
jgi:hypothetical protein